MAISLPQKLPNKKALRPRLLCSVGIPSPLSRVNPRLIRGRHWWKRQQQFAARSNNYRCAICGTHQRDAKINQYLEAHEIFSVNYNKKRSTFKSVVALCHYCHNVIHIKRLLLVLERRECTVQYIQEIVNHGAHVLHSADLPQTYNLAFAKAFLAGHERSTIKSLLAADGIYPLEKSIRAVDWNKWRMVYNGKLYAPKFKSHSDLLAYYQDK